MDNSALVNEMKKVVNDLDESQLKVEKHAFDVLQASEILLSRLTDLMR